MSVTITNEEFHAIINHMLFIDSNSALLVELLTNHEELVHIHDEGKMAKLHVCIAC